MLWVGLSGGIGSGKSTVSARLAALGAVVVDADRVAREVVEPGMPALAEIVDRFGPQVVGAGGTLDRAALGAVVFSDADARRDLEAITHPRIAARTRELVAAAPEDAVVVHDIPLLVELDRAADYALTVIVDVPAEVRLRRLVELRGTPEAEARRRIAAQADDASRHAAADVLLDNSGTVEELHAQVDRLWSGRLVPYEAALRAGRAARRPETLAVVEHDDRWPDQAARLLDRLRAALGDRAQRLDHIGSTSVAGLPAKDVVDLQVVVADLAVVDDPAVRRELARRGFVVVDDGREWFDHAHGAGGPADATWPKRMVATADPGRVVHCHVRESESPAWRLALLFRDWLRAEPGERERYAALKAGLLAQGLSTSAYAAAKEPWFAEAFPRAEAWAARTGWQPG
ncbi:dephospho-CoA kinase [Ornithinimicrobium tianjinense]|uniref:Dephospho-CoA kinase n=1 Tax=Ornithinimicrobium tianjinense TaxID=1195761 RepID=A0A917BHS2_9MICO|nr:dephospho-CoA kinase [Ornithinimicrobium tianjinense]GGF44421.1 dephospho-CoA kinase [Ornithinimicrobium tianjinense]